MPRKMRDRETGQDLIMCNVGEAARLLGVADIEIEHWIAHQLMSASIQPLRGGGEEYWVEQAELSDVRAFFQDMPDYWSYEQSMWYRFFATHRELQGQIKQYRDQRVLRSPRQSQHMPLRATVPSRKSRFPHSPDYSQIQQEQTEPYWDEEVTQSFPQAKKSRSVHTQRPMERRTLGCFEYEG